jgi:hypothetical protein
MKCVPSLVAVVQLSSDPGLKQMTGFTEEATTMKMMMGARLARLARVRNQKVGNKEVADVST